MTIDPKDFMSGGTTDHAKVAEKFGITEAEAKAAFELANKLCLETQEKLREVLLNTHEKLRGAAMMSLATVVNGQLIANMGMEAFMKTIEVAAGEARKINPDVPEIMATKLGGDSPIQVGDAIATLANRDDEDVTDEERAVIDKSMAMIIDFQRRMSMEFRGHTPLASMMGYCNVVAQLMAATMHNFEPQIMRVLLRSAINIYQSGPDGTASVDDKGNLVYHHAAGHA